MVITGIYNKEKPFNSFMLIEYSNSVEGRLPRLRYDTQKFLDDPKYAYSQSYRIDAMQALRNAKKGLLSFLLSYKNNNDPLN